MASNDDFSNRLSIPNNDSVGDMPAEFAGYRVVRQLGEGGMGIVYEAEQRQTRRLVALKVIRRGVASAQTLRRFEHESEALGRLRHEGIAQIYEAGAAELHGALQPYFAMELVDGKRIDEYTLLNKLSIERRLELLARVADAIQHAHARSVLHRDLKPDNILVDAGGQPKILDFGVARLTDAEPSVTLATSEGEVVGTAAYMSPEQISGDPVEVDTRSDVYALGVIGYQLVAGRMPYDLVGKTIYQVAEIIRDVEAPRLGRVSAVLRGDIETIFSKALEKDKERRYGSAAELAGDLRRFLKREPILARPPSAAYQIRRFAQRHTLLVGAAGLLVLAVLFGGITSTLLYLDAERARQGEAEQREVAQRRLEVAELAQAEAESAAATVAAINEFLLEDMLAAPDPWVAGRDVTVAEVLDRAAAGVAEAFDGRPRIEAAIRGTLAKTYRKLALYEAAAPHAERALALQRAEFGDEHTDSLAASLEVARLAAATGQTAEADSALAAALSAHQRRLGEQHPDTAAIKSELASVKSRLGDYERAEGLARSAWSTLDKAHGKSDKRSRDAMTALAWILLRTGNYDEAQQLMADALQICRDARGEEHPETIIATNGLAELLYHRDNLAEAETLYRQSLRRSERVFGLDHPDTCVAMIGLANVVASKGDNEGAVRLLQDAVERYTERLGGEHDHTLVARNNLADMLGRTGDLEAARAIHLANLEIRERKFGKSHADVGQTVDALGRLSLYLKENEAAVAYFSRSLAIFTEHFGEDYPDLAFTLANLASAHRRLEQYEQAIGVYERVLVMDRTLYGETHRYVAGDLYYLGFCQFKAGQAQTAERTVRDCLTMQTELELNDSTTDRTRLLVADILIARKELTAAQALLREVHSRCVADPKRRGQLRQSLERLVAVCNAQGRSSDAATWQRELDSLAEASES